MVKTQYLIKFQTWSVQQINIYDAHSLFFIKYNIIVTINIFYRHNQIL